MLANTLLRESTLLTLLPNVLLFLVCFISFRYNTGLPTGSSPIGVYKYLADAYKAGRISFKNVVTFNMDEYVGLPIDHPESYHSFMHKHFFCHIDIQYD